MPNSLGLENRGNPYRSFSPDTSELAESGSVYRIRPDVQ